MYLEDRFSFGGGHSGSTCRSCKQPILAGQHSTRVEFDTDPNGINGLTGDYHLSCSKVFASLAHAINMMSWHR